MEILLNVHYYSNSLFKLGSRITRENKTGCEIGNEKELLIKYLPYATCW